MKKELHTSEYVTLRATYKLLAEKVASILREILESEEVKIHAIDWRAKEIESFSKKAQDPKYDKPFEQITDLAGIRIITYVEDDLIKISSIVEEIFKVDPKNSLDKGIELGIDKVGYKSIHYVCELPDDRTKLPEYKKFVGKKFELQIRTILQHSWAEIEHDKDYKFSGELPIEIKRRFKILAGVLELADREFNNLAKDIDTYSKNVNDKTKRGELNIEINSTSLKQFLSTKFSSLIKSEYIEPHFNGAGLEAEVIKELKDFGIYSLEDLNNIIPKDYEEVFKSISNKENYNYSGLLRNFMIINDIEKYVNDAFSRNYSVLDETTKELLKSYNIDESLIIDVFNKIDNY